MQTANNLINHFRHRRILVCAIVALITLALTFGLRFISQRSENQQQISQFANHAVHSLERVLIPLSRQRESLSALVPEPCNKADLSLRLQAATLQTLRSISLVKSGILFCSSVLGGQHAVLREIQPDLPDSRSRLLLTTDQTLLKGSPLLVLWYPASEDGEDGVIMSINIQLLSNLLLEPQRPLIHRISVKVGNVFFTETNGVTSQLVEQVDEARYTLSSEQFPFSIIVSGPGAAMLALQDLPGQIPLAVILCLVAIWITWIATAGRMSFAREINLGIAAREFELYCQPLLNSGTLQCCGVEILLRWNNPRLGRITPDVFIPVAEREQLIAPLTRYVLIETVRHLSLFPASPLFHIGINVAASHFMHGLLLRDIHRYWYGAHPVQQLVLELTERDSLQDVDYRLIRELHRKGTLLAIDDFGTGNSALSWLEALRPDILKIDKSFTSAIGTDAVNSTVTDMIIALGQRLRIELVAEGVETTQQAHYLRSHGVAVLQGYLYAKPMPLAEFPRWLAGGSHPPAMQKRPVIPLHPC